MPFGVWYLYCVSLKLDDTSPLCSILSHTYTSHVPTNPFRQDIIPNWVQYSGSFKEFTGMKILFICVCWSLEPTPRIEFVWLHRYTQSISTENVSHFDCSSKIL